MAVTWGDLLADLRRDLQDEGKTPKWSDATIYMYVKDAVYDYSNYFPLRVDRSVLSFDGAKYDLPDDYIDVIAVENPEDRFLELRQDIPGRKYATSYRPVYFYISGGAIYLNGTSLDGESVLLTYQATHPVPASETDTTFEFTIPLKDIELVRLYVRAQIHEQMRSKTSRLDRFDPGSGRRDDNPLAKEFNLLLEEYYNKLFQRVGGGAVKLYRPGRVR